ncbi:LysR family transcriptional regulator [Alteromonas halophila]|uniref:LysR family transcriptional regulator n=1 Tax=Alteromonas halophila TaxID=516698 RepID=A0A918JQN2_9ALTE|nr:LysR family transcriptional regulator [Alteromonas halophila]GGW93288.1 LysR family transcriptional regulator [Alteromonas halophila]
MDTSAVRLFILAAEQLNIGAAGQTLGLSASVASARLAKLERMVGADLFHRSTRKIRLSVEGQAFLPYAREIIAQENAALAALGKGQVEPSGTLRFAASSTFAQRYIAPLLPEFLARYPKINIDLTLSDTQTNLIEGGFDLALRNYPAQDSSLIGRKLANDVRVLCAAPQYLKTFGCPSSPADLRDHQLIVFGHTKARKLVRQNGQHNAVFPPNNHPRVTCDDGASMRLAAEAGVGICMSSLWNIETELRQKRLVRVLPDYHIEDNSAIWLVYPKSNVLTAKVRVLIDFLVEKLEHLSALTLR